MILFSYLLLYSISAVWLMSYRKKIPVLFCVVGERIFHKIGRFLSAMIEQEMTWVVAWKQVTGPYPSPRHPVPLNPRAKFTRRANPRASTRKPAEISLPPAVTSSLMGHGDWMAGCESHSSRAVTTDGPPTWGYLATREPPAYAYH